MSASTGCLGGRKSLFAHTARRLPRTTHQATACHPCHASHSGLAQSLVQLAAGVRHCATGDLSPLALPGIPALLALEIHAWTAADPYGPASPQPPYGAGEPVVGRGAYRQRTLAQARLTRVPPHHTQVSAHAPEPWTRETRDDTTLAHLCASSCPSDRGV